MSEIPEDIQRMVGALLGPCDERMNRAAYNALSLGIARAILAERLAQQEQDAKIADEALYSVRAGADLFTYVINIASSIRQSHPITDKERT